MSQPLFIFVLPTGNNEIIKQICYLLFSLSKSILMMIHLKNISTTWFLLIKTSLFQEHLPEAVTERCSLKST